MFRKTRRRFGITEILFTLLASILCACDAENVTGKPMPQEQYEVALKHRSELGKFEEDLVSAMGRADWGQGLDPGKAGTGRCPGGRSDDFLFKRSRSTPRAAFPFSEEHERSAAIAKAGRHLAHLGMQTHVEPRSDEIYLYGEGPDFTVLIMFVGNGAAQMIVKTSCSTEWPDFTLTQTEFAELEYRNSYGGTD